jgi:hypothetical protein
MPKKGKRSPFPRPSLPQAGESLGDAAIDLYMDKFLYYVAVAGSFAVVAFAEWVMRWTGGQLTPWFWTTFAIAATLFATYRYFRIKPQLERLRQGVRGEREVGRMFEDLRALGYKVFHDIPGDGFNVDHALIGPAGVFAIETKTWSMPEKGRAEIDYDGQQVIVNGMEPDRNPVAQAEACASHLRDILKRMTDREVAVRPVVLFPGWWVNQKVRECRAWVLNPKALPAFLKKEQSRLTPEDAALFADRLTRHLLQ